MNIQDIEKVKGFMPKHEGQALFKWAKKFSNIGPILEIGTYCGKSALYLADGAATNNQYVFTIDHHAGSEEHQLNEEYFDNEIYDHSTNKVNTFPLFIDNLNKFKANNVVPIISQSSEIASKWSTKLGMVFVDGGHSIESAFSDYISWEPKILTGGSLVIHDIFENPNEGGQAPYKIYKKALKNNYELYERVDTIACLIKN
jgi:predicted O-methyltransferase YrrM